MAGRYRANTRPNARRRRRARHGSGNSLGTRNKNQYTMLGTGPANPRRAQLLATGCIRNYPSTIERRLAGVIREHVRTPAGTPMPHSPCPLTHQCGVRWEMERQYRRSRRARSSRRPRELPGTRGAW